MILLKGEGNFTVKRGKLGKETYPFLREALVVGAREEEETYTLDLETFKLDLK